MQDDTIEGATPGLQRGREHTGARDGWHRRVLAGAGTRAAGNAVRRRDKAHVGRSVAARQARIRRPQPRMPSLPSPLAPLRACRIHPGIVSHKQCFLQKP